MFHTNYFRKLEKQKKTNILKWITCDLGVKKGISKNTHIRGISTIARCQENTDQNRSWKTQEKTIMELFFNIVCALWVLAATLCNMGEYTKHNSLSLLVT